MTFEVSGAIWYWKGPSPFHFLTIPADRSREIKEIAALVTYGWGMIPVRARIGKTVWSTALWEKDGLYILPIKVAVRRAEKVEEGDSVEAEIEVVKSDWG